MVVESGRRGAGPARRSRPVAAGRAVLGFAAIAFAFQALAEVNDSGGFADLSLEELATIRITSVSKRSESLADAPSSIFVISNDEIRRSGATTLPEVLRLAPNLEVARVDARNYAITARGFNNPFENKLLVLIDGRTVYSPLFSGVFWDAQDVVLEDIERIEVISGPGATLWGANAVNGVINIITRSSARTQGGLVAFGGGAREKNGVVRYGGALPDGGYFRVYAKYADNDDLDSPNGAKVMTGWRRDQAGFRTDWDAERQAFTFQGDAYRGRLHQAGTADIGIDGANLTGRSVSRFGDHSEVTVAGYWDYTHRNQPGAFVESLNTFDLQVQHAFLLGGIHNVVWGGGYRLAQDDVRNGQVFAFLPGTLDLHWANVFVQDEMALTPTVRLTAGVKVENDTYARTELLPTLRLAWKPTEQHLLWTSASRAVRTPSRIDRDFYSPTQPQVVGGVPQYAVAGGPGFQSEVARVFEVGYRGQPTTSLSFSATLFASRYTRLRTLEPNPDGVGTVFMNRANGTTRGVETWGTWQVLPSWRMSGGLVVQRVRTRLDPGSQDQSGSSGLATADPNQHWLLRSSFDVAKGHDLDVTVRHSGNVRQPAVEGYTTMDVRYAWQVLRNLEVSIVGQNLLQSSHQEFSSGVGATEFDRSVFVKLLWRP